MMTTQRLDRIHAQIRDYHANDGPCPGLDNCPAASAIRDLELLIGEMKVAEIAVDGKTTVEPLPVVMIRHRDANKTAEEIIRYLAPYGRIEEFGRQAHIDKVAKIITAPPEDPAITAQEEDR